MSYKELVLNLLLEKYENSAHFNGESNRRVQLECAKCKELPASDHIDYIRFVESVKELESEGLVEIKWITKNYSIEKIYLKLDKLERSHALAHRTDKHDILKNVSAAITECRNRISSEWITCYLDQSLEYISTRNKLTGIWNKSMSHIIDYLSAIELIDSLNGSSISMRAASVKLYADSKHFEKFIKSDIIAMLKKYEPMVACTEDANDRAVLAHVGIIAMPEVFEFCGNVKIEFENGTVDYSPIKSGACISGTCISEIKHIEIFDTSKIVFIENKTNYIEYCLNQRTSDEIVVYHGGLYSPVRKEFFKLLQQGLHNEEVLFWGDIDLGGFRMYARLKTQLFPQLKPYKMGIDEFERYKINGLQRNKAYIDKLIAAKTHGVFFEFDDVINAIINYGVTIEQECFLE